MAVSPPSPVANSLQSLEERLLSRSGDLCSWTGHCKALAVLRAAGTLTLTHRQQACQSTCPTWTVCHTSIATDGVQEQLRCRNGEHS